MISRRIIRTKAMHTLYAFYSSSEKSISNTEKELFFSIQKAYDLYHLLLALGIEVKKYAAERIESNRNKLRPTEDDLNPNLRFVNNAIIKKLEENVHFNEYLTDNKLSWINSEDMIQQLYRFMVETDLYIEYMASEEDSFEQDKKFMDKFFTRILLNFEDLFSELEETSVYWNDDVDFIVSIISRTVKKFKAESSEHMRLLPLFKDDEDREFAQELIRKVLINHKEYNTIIKDNLKNWDIDRIAFLDIIIMEMAVTEFLEFTAVPTKVTLNEYIELSKRYSTSRSSTFINGILDKILKDLKKNDRVKKAGRGLIGE
ncbi:transcription antitermination factor NusB [Prolixibacteraceae bacterium JC049]|nr:transcription antitermination factor NusB [Prolixibacteraceae bacterium JC049]